MLGDVERLNAALRAGVQPQQVCGKDSLTRRALKPDTTAHGPVVVVREAFVWGGFVSARIGALLSVVAPRGEIGALLRVSSVFVRGGERARPRSGGGKVLLRFVKIR